ncbi:phosphoribosylamine--glycine ligase [Pelagirhabdus alkalitolerans]|uniref:Phosphoribosylamine--glycine ligase n=1 Tax=Pelagirhabdus alkalitolerans TaxID=1612202 RepID=A0A1G6ITK3_9BACI|nr:phosphoribosylamine--glycine ligase [Pelagirhabdus alkalitolerans]SDC09837.1 phosphoribosylamine--glycine ligase [Pelagirhabdus alkalitolerans]
MKVLIVGSGGREHMLVKTLSTSKRVKEIFVAPGNGGIEDEATTVNIREDDLESLVEFAKSNEIDWTIVGPEIPLAQGIVNRFRQENLLIFGPTQEAARIESSKDFAKGLMKKHQIPTARYETFTDSEKAKAYVKEQGVPIVIKADGLAAGKGVVVATEESVALGAIEDMLDGNRFGAAGARVVIEEFLDGEEFSLFAFVNGEHVYPMIPARDFKRAFENDEGPNTGGMGAYAPVSDLEPSKIEETIKHVLEPTAKAMVDEGVPFTGILYAGLIETKQGVKVIEFNARFGDPETQVVLPLLENDLIDVIEKVSNGEDPNLQWKDACAVGVVVASSGYPGAYEKDVELPPLPSSATCYVTHAGTKKASTQTYASTGGRVLLVGSIQDSYENAQKEINHYLSSFDVSENFFYRNDIGPRR